MDTCNEDEKVFFTHRFLQSIPNKNTSDYILTKHALEENSALLNSQRRLEKVSNLHFRGLTINQTLYKCIWEMTNTSAAPYIDWMDELGKLMKDFKVSEVVLWHLKLQCYSRCNRYDLIRNLAIQKQSPIGYRPFAVVCIE